MPVSIRIKMVTVISNDDNYLSHSLDIDECKLGHDCQDICSNTLGGYKCSCIKGYQLNTDKRTCTGKV